MSNGWILLHRKFFEHHLWKENRELSKAEAWIDLIQQARWKKDENSMMIKGQIIKWNRGQLIGSIRFLKKRWNWKSTKKVHSFLQLLEKENMISLEKETPATRITICNYDTYQEVGNGDGNTKETQRKQSGNKTEKKDKESKEYSALIEGLVRVNKMDNPLTKEEAKKLTDKYGESNVIDILKSMENYKPLLKKNTSTYLTANNWLKRDFKNANRDNGEFNPEIAKLRKNAYKQ